MVSTTSGPTSLRLQKPIRLKSPGSGAGLPTLFRVGPSNAYVYTYRYKLMPKRKFPAAVPLESHWFQILLALADRDLHGLAIMNDVLEHTGGRMRLWPGMLYRALGRLADIGLIAQIESPDDVAVAGGRPRFFRITAAGRRACAAEAERLAGFVELAKRKKLLKA